MHKLRRLVADRLYNPRMRMAQGIHAQPGYKIQIALPINVKEEYAFAAAQHYRIPAIGR